MYYTQLQIASSKFRFYSFPEYSASRFVGADDSVRPNPISDMFVVADGERSRQRRRSATDAAYPLRVHIGPPVGYSGNEQNQNPLSAIRNCVWYTCQNDKLSEVYQSCARRGR